MLTGAYWTLGFFHSFSHASVPSASHLLGPPYPPLPLRSTRMAYFSFTFFFFPRRQKIRSAGRVSVCFVNLCVRGVSWARQVDIFLDETFPLIDIWCDIWYFQSDLTFSVDKDLLNKTVIYILDVWFLLIFKGNCGEDLARLLNMFPSKLLSGRNYL